MACSTKSVQYILSSNTARPYGLDNPYIIFLMPRPLMSTEQIELNSVQYNRSKVLSNARAVGQIKPSATTIVLFDPSRFARSIFGFPPQLVQKTYLKYTIPSDQHAIQNGMVS